ncbi:protein split ends isoform X2 [Planococcus citri]|uniref:protein split ends isoform X2 n=1 Tax=Planococcus citri TaxID=170843 RepID=UPI0031F82E57
MVRETRHLWVGNLPENIREDRLRELFKRHGRVQSVKIFSRKGGGECEGNALVGCGPTGICATVSFMDIKSATKALNNEITLDEYTLTTEYYEPPAAIPSVPPASAVPPSVSAGGSPVTQATPPSLRHPPPYSSPRFTHGPSEEITTFDRSSHFYERRDGTENYVRRPPSAYHVVSPSDSLRGRTRERDRLYRNGPSHYTPILDSVVARTPSTHHRTVTTTSWNSYEGTNCSRYSSSVVSTPEILSYQEERRESTPVIIVHKKHPKSRRKCRVMRRRGSNGSESVSNNSDSSRSRSHSSSSSSHSRSSSSSSDSSSAAISERSCSTHSHHGSLKSTVTVHSTISTPLTNCSPVVHTDDRRPLAICVRNLPARSSDSSLKDGLYHEYKKHGKVTSVKVLGQGANRYAIVCFKKADDVEKALQVSHDKLFFGSKIEVTIYHGYDVEDNDFRPIEAELDEYHPKATRTLFIGNLEKDVSVNDLRNTFQKFGEIIDIDLKKQGVTSCYAFCQYCDISSVVKAMHAMDGEYFGSNKINLGYGKSLATNCLWVAGVADCVTEKQLSGSFSQFGHVTHVDIDRSQGKALVFFQQITHAQAALSQMRGYVLKNRRLMADYASRECQENFYDNYEKSKSVISAYENNCQDSPRSTGSTRGLDTPASSTSSNGGGGGGNSNTTSKTILNTSSSNTNNSSSDKLHPRYQHTTPTLRTTPTHQTVQQTPSSNSASPIVNNTPSPSPSTSSRSTPRPQQTSRFDYSNTECSSERRISRSLEDLNINIESNTTSSSEKAPPTTPNPQDDVTLQKERVSLLEQLNDYSSSEDDDDEEELSSTKQQSSIRQHRSTSREESRPGTPLCDERPENILAHYESRRAAKEKNTSNTPLSLPLPSFANKVPRSSSPSDRSSKSPHQSKPHHVSRPPPPFESSSNSNVTRTLSSSSTSSYTRRSPSPHAKEKPSILDSKLSNITSFDSLTETLKAPWIEQLKSLDEKYEKWHGTRCKVMSGKLDTSAIQVKHKLLDVNSIGRQRSEICQTVLSRKSVFDDHFKRLETITDQTPPTEFPSPRVTINNTVRSHNTLITSISNLPSNVCSKPSTVNNVAVASTSSASSSTPTSSSSTSSSSSSSSSSVIKGLQYPFPSHPPPVKSTATTTTTPTTPKPLLLNNFNASSNSTAVSGKQSDINSISPPTSAPLPSPHGSSSSSSTRTNAILRNNSVEKLTELPKNPLPITSRETLSRLEPVAAIDKKDIVSPVNSRRGSIESIGRKSTDDMNELINERVSATAAVKDKYNCKSTTHDQSGDKPNKIVNHETKPKFNNCSYESKSTTSNEKENSVLDKRKNSVDRTIVTSTVTTTTITATIAVTSTISTSTLSCASTTVAVASVASTSASATSPESCNTVSVIFHTSQRDKLSKSLEDVSEIDKPSTHRRSSIEVHKEERVTNEKIDEKVVPKKEIVNNIHKKIDKSEVLSKKPTNFANSSKELDVMKRDKKEMVNHCDKIGTDDKKSKVVSYNHVNSEDEDRKKDTKIEKKEDKRIPPPLKDVKNESAEDKDPLEIKMAEIDEDDDDSNDIDDNKTTLVKNKIIETVFNVKHEKKKSVSDGKDEEVKPPKEKKKSVSDKSSHSSKEKINKKEDKSKKECIKTKEFNMFENKSLEKKKNHFLSERRKSNDLEGRETEKSSGKHKENEQIIDKSKSEKKNKHETKQHKDEKSRKCEEKRESSDVVKVEEKLNKFEEKLEKKTENVFNKTESSCTNSSNSINSSSCSKKETPKILVESTATTTTSTSTSTSTSIKEKEKEKEKRKEKLVGQPENGKIKHDYHKKYSKEHENNKKHSSEKETSKSDTLELEKIDLKSANTSSNFYKNKLTHESVSRKEIERKNSSSSSSLSDSVHSKSKSSYDSVESNNDDKRHDTPSDHVSKRSSSEKHKNNSISDSMKDEKRSERKKSEKSGLSSKRKKSKKRKTPSDSSSDSDFESYDESKSNKKNHSIFEVVLDEPAYISMYDKVKARSTKNLQKQEEEKRQEKLKEKFNQLKQSRVKREEKKRSTSYDDDTDHEPTIRKGNKLMLDSSDEEHSSNDKMNKINLHGVTDSSDDDKKKPSDDDDATKFVKSISRSINGKNKEKSKLTQTDSSDEEVKNKQKKDQLFLLSSTEHKRKFKKGMSNKKRPSSHKIENKKKIESDSDDERKKEYFSANKQKYSDLSDDDIPKPPKKIFDKKSSRKLHTADFVKKKPKSELKMMIESGELEKKNAFIPMDDDLKRKSLMSDVSEDEDYTKLNESDHKPQIIDKNRVKLEKIFTDTSENESITSYRFPKSKTCAIYSDDSEPEPKPKDKADDLFFNLAELHHDFTKSENSSPPPLIDPMVYDVGDFQKKKSHKKKQKRQKSREHSMDRAKRHSKKERRKSIHSDVGEEDKEHKLKQKKKKKSRNKVKSIENLEEDIFGSMSDDSEKADARKLSKLSVSDVYDADSDSSNKDTREDEIHENAKPDVETKLLNSVENTNSYDNYFEHIKSKKKKRKKSKEEKSKHHHHHHHHHHNHHHTKHEDVPPALSLPCLIEPRSLEIGKEDNKEEDDDKADDRHDEIVDIVTNSIAESHHEKLQKKDTEVPNVEMKNVFAPLPSLDENVHEKAVKSISNDDTKDEAHDRAIKSIASTAVVDTNVHERAVLSIFNSLTDIAVEVKEPTRIEEPKITPPVVDDKTGITISQEETEDAVAAILGESPEFGFDDECYPDDAMKPGTPGSEPDLQIDTDTEDVKSDIDNSFDISEPLSLETTIEKLDANIKADNDELEAKESSNTDKSSSGDEISSMIVDEKEPVIEKPPEKVDSLIPKPVIDLLKSVVEPVIPANKLNDISKLASDEVLKKPHASDFVKSKTPEPRKESSSFIVVNSHYEKISEKVTDDKLTPTLPPKVTIPPESVTPPARESDEMIKDKPRNEELTPKKVTPPLPPPIESPSSSDSVKNDHVVERSHNNNKTTERLVFNNFSSKKPRPEIDNPLYASCKPNNIMHVDDHQKLNAKSRSHSVLKSLSSIHEHDKPADTVEVVKKNKERKRSFIECNGPTSIEPETTKFSENTVIKIEPNPEPEPVGKNNVAEESSKVDVSPRSVSPSSIDLPTADVPVKPETSTSPVPKEDSSTSENDHTYNSVVKNAVVKAEQLPEDEPKPERLSPQTVICEAVAEKSIEDVPAVEKDTKDDSDQSKEKGEPDALKQLQIPTANEKLLDSVDDGVKSTAECNEANKENIVKTIVNQDNFVEGNDDSKLNVIVRNKERDIKEIARSVEEEIFRSVPNELSKCNHRMPENNRNILEKVVQRIHESKRITQKVEDPQNAELTRINLTDKTEDEITSAKILLKMSESSVIKNKVSDYNCVIKIHDNPIVETEVECKCDGVKDLMPNTGGKKNEALSPSVAEPEVNEDMSESADDAVAGTKLNDHSYNAKRGRRRKASAPGGVVTRRGKQNNVITKETESKSSFKLKKPTDVYEFKEDSEEEVKRPRLILTIKSPVEPSQPAPTTPPTPPVTTVATTTPSKETSPPPNEVKPSNSNETTPTGVKSASSANTRKSRRLLEKEGGSRNTVDDTIDEVIKSTANNQRPTRRTTRIAAAAAAAIITTVHESARKNSRANRKPTSKQETAVQSETTNTPAAAEEKDDFPSSPAIPARLPSPVTTPDSPASSKTTSSEPTTLIDPVSGILMPMKESDEGQSQKPSQQEDDSPPEKKPRLDDSLIEESALALVKNTAEPVIVPKLVTKPAVSPKAPETVAVTTSVIASVTATSSAACVPLPSTAATDNVVIPAAHSASVPHVNVDNEPISLIKTSTPPIIPVAASMKSHTPPLAYNQPSFPPVVYSQNQPVTKLLTSKTVTPQPRVLTPITPKAHIMQSLNLENDTHSNDEVPYPPQYTSPLLHGTVASPPLGSPKISPQPIVSGASNTRVAHPLKNMVPLEPLRIDPPSGYFYMPNTSPSSRPAVPVQSPSPQPRVVHSTSTMGSNILPHSAVQSSHYVHPQFMYQPYIPESSLTPYHIPPSASSAAATVIGSAKGIPDREIIDSRQPPQPAEQQAQQVVTNTSSMTPSPPLELRKKSSPHNRLSDSPLITSPYVQSNRSFFYDEPIQAHRPLPAPARIRVSTPPYASKVPQQSGGEPVDMYVSAQSRVNLDTSRYTSHDDAIDNETPPPRQFIDASYGSHRPTRNILPPPETELDYSRGRVVRLRGDDDIVASRDSSPSQMDSPPLGDSPPQGNLDGTVLVQMYPIIWQGLLALKNDQAAVQMHVVSGNTSVAYDALPTLQDGFQPLLRIAQRMRLEQPQLEQVNRKMEIRDEHCTILGLPCGRNQEDVVQQATNLESYIIPYLRQKKAAGIINVAAPGTQQAAFVVHVFPPCEFADNVLLNAAPDLYRRVQETAYLVCIIVTV